MNTTQYNRCVDAHADHLYRFVLGIVRRQDEAEDIVQESFTRLWENRSKAEKGKEKSYLFAIAYNLAISELRKRKHTTSEELNINDYAENREYNNLTELLWKALDSISENGRTAIMLCDWEGYSYNEIAEIMGSTLAQVKITIHRARTAIKDKIGNEYRI